MGFGWVVFGKSSCYWLYSGDVDEMLMCQLLRQCARLKVFVFVLCFVWGGVSY